MSQPTPSADNGYSSASAQYLVAARGYATSTPAAAASAGAGYYYDYGAAAGGAQQQQAAAYGYGGYGGYAAPPAHPSYADPYHARPPASAYAAPGGFSAEAAASTGPMRMRARSDLW